MTKKLIRLILISLPALILFSAILARMSANTVNESGMEEQTQEVTANQIKPAACDGIDLSAIYTDSDGAATNDLVLGTSASNTLNGNDGDDCLVGSSGDDTLDGGAGADVCIGGDGADSFLNCETQVDP